MFKTDGRKTPADKSELAGLKGKHMVCPQCGEIYVISKASFADERCQGCGVKLEDVQYASSKLDGSR